VERWEERVRELERALGDGALYDGTSTTNDKVTSLVRELNEAKGELGRAVEAWTTAVEHLESHSS
jgi:hypothetical protein